MKLQGATPTVSGAVDNNGDFFPLDSLQQALVGPATKPTGLVATDGKNTWTRTYTYDATSGVLVTTSMWVKG